MREQVKPFYDQNAQMDAARLETMRLVVAGEPIPPPPEDDPFTTFATGLQLAALFDPEVSRAMGKVAQVLDQPMNVVADPAVAAAAIDAWERRAELTPPPTGPTREELLAAMGTATARSRGAAG
jgi:hypothetical protein